MIIYKTTDGKIFKDPERAVIHQDVIDFMTGDYLHNTGFICKIEIREGVTK